jgi:DNA-binding HxlR family transcriptional regulator
MPGAHTGSKPRRQWAPDARALGVVGDRWLMVIVRDLAPGPVRLDVLRRWLPGVSAGALEARLARMAEAGLLVRRRHRELPPRVDLELTDEGRALATAIGELARWELRRQWSAPQEDEWIDVAACFRLAPFLLAPDAAGATSGDGELALIVLDDAGDELDAWAFVRAGGRARVEHRAAPDAVARLAGTQEAWVRALSPGGSPAALAIDGRARPAAAFLELFAAGTDAVSHP